MRSLHLMLRDYVLRLSLNQKLVLMMLLLSVCLTSVLIFFYSQSEQAIYRDFTDQYADLSQAIQIAVEEATKSGATDETKLRKYLNRLKTKGVQEISLISNSDRIISSTNPGNVGKWLTTKRKELIFKAQLGETVTGEGAAYNVIVPVVAGDKRYGYIHLTITTEEFSSLLRQRLLQRIVAALVILGIGTVVIFYLAKRYTQPIEDVVAAARMVAGGDLDQELKTDRRDEIGELTESFNYMIRKLREERDLEERLRKAEHLAGIGQFSQSIAHEIRNPLNFMSLSIDHIREKYAPAGDKARDSFDSLIANIKKEIQRVSRFAESFLEYGKPLQLNIQITPMERMIDDTLELVSARAEKEHIAIERNFGGSTELAIDPDLMKTCLYNIILNAFQAMPKGGSIRIGTTVSADRYQMQLQDSGIGIPAERLSRIFDPFFTTKSGGLGLGLALTKRVIEEHRGKVEITSREGSGTTVTLILPMNKENRHAGDSGR